MNTALNIRNVGAPLKAALAARAKELGIPMSDLARNLLAEELGVKQETPAEKWRRENAAGLAAHDARAQSTYERNRAMSVHPMPAWSDEL